MQIEPRNQQFSATMEEDVGPTSFRSSSHQKKSRKDMEKFASELENTVNRSLPPRIKPYSGVYVLAMHWSNDQMGVGGLEDELCLFLDTVYGYTVEKYLIDATLSQYNTRIEFSGRLGKFMKDYNEEGNLLIVVYSGHAAHVNSESQFLLAGNLDHRSDLVQPTLDWYQNAGTYINDTDADVLIILDCCYASSTALQNSTGPEVLAASTWHSTAGAALSTSFTQNLMHELKQLNGNPASVASIYAQIHRNTKPYKDITVCPLHIPKIGEDSIILSRLHLPTIRSQMLIGPLQPNEERIVITVHLSDSNGAPPDLAQWTTWLTSKLPSHISKTQITIEGVFDTNSILLLVSLPLEVWTMLPREDEAYGFVSFVNSGNRLLPRQPTFSSRNEKENLPMTLLPKDQRGLGGSGGSGGYSGFGGSPGGR